MIEQLDPKGLWSNFSKLNAVPRPSKKEERVIQFMMDFGKSLGLETLKDAIGNVIIKKPASPGMENAKTVIMQSHLDMVHQKNNDTEFDFLNQGIEMVIENDWVKAKGTTLGADNGIGVAAIMAVLESEDIVHPAIEALFTIDEETGMTGAMELDGSLLKGEILLNLDTEDDDELSIGCAGGIDTNTSVQLQTEGLKPGSSLIKIEIKGLLGGHSGMDIDKGRGNANKLMNRLLFELSLITDYQLISIDGGSLRNAIPRESIAEIAVSDVSELKFHFDKIATEIRTEFKAVEPGMVMQMDIIANSAVNALAQEERDRLIHAVYSVHNGVFRMSPDIEGLVEASSSLARVILKDGSFETQSLQRSSVESSKRDVANTIAAPFRALGAEVVQNGDYPGWQPNPDSEILQLMESLYRDKFNEEPNVKACHAGLECGILLKHLPGVDMISFGPNIRAAHSPDEKVQISSVQKFWDYLMDVLQKIPA
ncbi:MAG: aminoacyl-histidine dipeptidase [Crocinitomicaceae bacterium]